MLNLLTTDPEINPESGIACDLRKVNLDDVRNPIGFLQEYLQKRGESLPVYTPKEDRRPPFSYKVQIDSLGKLQPLRSSTTISNSEKHYSNGNEEIRGKNKCCCTNDSSAQRRKIYPKRSTSTYFNRIGFCYFL